MRPVAQQESVRRDTIAVNRINSAGREPQGRRNAVEIERHWGQTQEDTIGR